MNCIAIRVLTFDIPRWGIRSNGLTSKPFRFPIKTVGCSCKKYKGFRADEYILCQRFHNDVTEGGVIQFWGWAMVLDFDVTNLVNATDFETNIDGEYDAYAIWKTDLRKMQGILIAIERRQV